MVEEILAAVRNDVEVCAAFYGHPAVFVHASHASIAQARAEGFRARMLPAVSAEDCLFADLGVDPGETGCQSYDATDFLIHRRRVDPTAALVLWQVSAIGMPVYEPGPARALDALAESLLEHYPSGHEVTLYEASPYPIGDALIEVLPLGRLADSRPTPLATLYVPPLAKRRPDPEMLERLGLDSLRRPLA